MKEPLCIAGIGCRFGSDIDSPSKYYSLLQQRKTTITDVPSTRWNAELYTKTSDDKRSNDKSITSKGSFIKDEYLFDNKFFNINPREAENMDPQQRMLLEVVYETLQDGYIKPETIRGTNTGVFIGAGLGEYWSFQVSDIKQMNSYVLTGNIANMNANRISFYYDLKGPSFTLDTACSSSLTAFHLACQSLWDEETTMCIVGGSSLCLTPELFVAFTNLGVLSPNGQCKPFDKQADGYARGEGITCVVLTTLKLAKEKNYKIYCEVKASGIAHDGHKTSITTPSSKEQQNLIEKVFNKFHIDKETIDYFEAHGTGTSVGDPLELMAISNTFSSKLKPIRVGSVKGNIGHTEYSAGLASVIKVALMIYYKQLLPTNNFNELTTKMNFNNIEIQNELESFSLNDKITCCINSFGFGGSNSHVVLQSIEQNEEYCLEEQQKSILMLSAHSPSSLIETCKKWKEFCLNKTNDNLFQTSILQAFGRSSYKYKVAFDFQSNEQLLQLIDLFIKDQQEQIINTRIHHNLMKKDKSNNKIAFVFCGQGHHYLSMGTWLYNNINVFKLKVDDCDEIIYQLTGKYLIKEYNLFTDKCKLTEEQFSSGPIFIPVTLTTILQIGLLELLKSWNIVPDVVLGHSIGDIIAAYACGAIALRETLKIVIIRTNLMEKVSQTAYNGKMIALEITAENQIENLIKDMPDLVISAYNNPNIMTVSGSASSIDLLAKQAEQKNIKKKILNVKCAYHSSQMDIIKDEFYHLLNDIQYVKPNESITFISTTTGEIYNGPFDTNYFWNNIRNPVQFANALLIAKQQARVDFVIEVGPSPSLGKILKYYFNQNQLIYLTDKRKSQISTLLSATAALFPNINNMNIENVYEFISKKNLCYIKQNNSLPTISWDHNKIFNNTSEKIKQKYDLCGPSQTNNNLIHQQEYHNNESLEKKFGIVQEHVFDNKIIFPAAGYLSLVSEHVNSNLLPSQAIIFENVQFLVALIWNNKDQPIIPEFIQNNKSDNTFECTVKNTIHCKGKVRIGQFLFQEEEHLTLKQLKQYKPLSCINTSELKKVALTKNFDYGTEFSRIENIYILNEYEVFATLFKTKSRGFKIHPGVLDSLFQTLVPLLEFKKGLPVGIESISIKQGMLDTNQLLFAHAILSKRNSNTFYVNITVYNEHGEIVLIVKNLTFKDIASSISPIKVQDWIFTNMKQSKYIPLSIWQDMELKLFNKKLFIEDIIKSTIKNINDLNPKRIFRLLDIGSNLYPINQDEIICNYTSIVQKLPTEINNKNSNLIDRETWAKISTYNLNSFDFIIVSSTNWSLTDIANYVTPYGWIFYPSELNINSHFDKQFKNIPSVSDKWNKWTAVQIIPANKLSQSSSFVILVDSLTLKIAEEFQKHYNSLNIIILNLNNDADKTEEAFKNITDANIVIDLRCIYSTDIYNTTMVFKTLSKHIFIITTIDQEMSNAIKGLCRVAQKEMKNKKIISIEISNINNLYSEIFSKIIQGQYGEEFEYFLDKNDEVMVSRIIKHEITNHPQRSIPNQLKSDGYYLITGAFGGIGLHIALWASTKGASKFIFPTSNNIEEKQKNPIVNYLKSIACEVIICKCDITSPSDVKTMVHNRKIRGIFHLANKLQDGLISSINRETIRNGFNPKAIGAKNLHDATIHDDVELFIMFSSLASIFGNIGQGIYCSANGYLTSIAKTRHEKNLHAVVIHLPVIEDCGYLNDKNHQRELLLLKQKGYPCAKINDLIKLLDIYLKNNNNNQNDIVMSADNMNIYLESNKNYLMYIHNCNWDKVKQTKDNIVSNLLVPENNSLKTKKDNIVSKLFIPDNNSLKIQKENLHQQVKTTTTANILKLVKTKIMDICGLSDEDIKLESQLSDLSFDSLTATELSHWIKNEFSKDITQEQLFSSEITLQDLIRMLSPDGNFPSNSRISSNHQSDRQIHKISDNTKLSTTKTTTTVNILKLVKTKIMDICGLSDEDIKLDSQLSDLSFDSLTATELSHWIKNEFNKDITHEQLFSSEITLQDLIKMLSPDENFQLNPRVSNNHQSDRQIHKISDNTKISTTTVNILQSVKTKIMDICGLSDEDIKLESQLSDLSFDSLTATELSHWIKNEFNKDITQEQLFSSEITLQDLIRMLSPDENFQLNSRISNDHQSDRQIHKISDNPKLSTTTTVNILKLVKTKIMDICGLSDEDIKLESQLSDLSFDSLTATELSHWIKNEFNKDITQEQLFSSEITLQDLIRMLSPDKYFHSNSRISSNHQSDRQLHKMSDNAKLSTTATVNILKLVKTKIMDICGLSDEDIKLESQLSDLSFDSLTATELSHWIKNEFNKDITQEQLFSSELTLQDLIRMIDSTTMQQQLSSDNSDVTPTPMFLEGKQHSEEEEEKQNGEEEEKQIIVETDERSVTITFNNQSKENAFNPNMLKIILESIDIEKMLIIKANGDSFCIGWDVSLGDFDSLIMQNSLILYGEVIKKISSIRQPIITLCQGKIRGGGMAFVCLSDIVISDQYSTFGFPEIRTGRLPALVSSAASNRLIPTIRRKLMLFGDVIDANTAKSYNLIDTIGANKKEMVKELSRILTRLKFIDPLMLKICKENITTTIESALVRVCEAKIYKEQHQINTDYFNLVRIIKSDNYITILELNSSKNFNSMDEKIAYAMRNAIDLIKNDIKNTKCIVLHGTGKHFCIGADKNWIKELQKLDSILEISSRIYYVFKTFASLREIPVPILTAVHGTVVGGGLCLVSNSDWTGSVRDAKFILGLLYKGLNPGIMLSKTLKEKIGISNLFNLYLNNMEYTAQYALEIGLIHQIYENKQIMFENIMLLAKSIVSNSELGVKNTINLIRTPLDDDVIRKECLGYAECIKNNPSNIDKWNTIPTKKIDELIPKQQMDNDDHYGRRPLNVGIIHMECYIPKYCVSQTDMEIYHNCIGNYTTRLGQKAFGFSYDNEDIVSYCLNVVTLMMKNNPYNITYKDIGRLEIGTESSIDLSKSVKTYIMKLFEENNNTDIEGVDSITACYGGTAALFNTVNWIESSSWDGRYGLVIAADIAKFEDKLSFLDGAGAVALLIGPNAPLVVESKRSSFMANRWDFFKPIDNISKYPIFYGHHSMDCYFEALAKCEEKFKEKNHLTNLINNFDYFIFHCTTVSVCKKAFDKIIENDWNFINNVNKTKLQLKQELFKEKVEPSLHIASLTGSNFTAAVYMNLMSSLLSKKMKLNSKILVFSYGSGCASSMYSLKINNNQLKLSNDIFERLNNRIIKKPEDFYESRKLYESKHQILSWSPTTLPDNDGNWYLEKVENDGRRNYTISKAKLNIV